MVVTWREGRASSSFPLPSVTKAAGSQGLSMYGRGGFALSQFEPLVSAEGGWQFQLLPPSRPGGWRKVERGAFALHLKPTTLKLPSEEHDMAREDKNITKTHLSFHIPLYRLLICSQTETTRSQETAGRILTLACSELLILKKNKKPHKYCPFSP